MRQLSEPVSVEYVIEATSDWTTFQIIEGGWWSDLHIVCREGCDKLKQEVLYNEKTIVISKRELDRSKVIVHVRCTLNIVKEYFQSDITYLITKGDIESTVVRVTAEGKEQPPLVNAHNVPNNPRNPCYFNVPVKHYLQALEEKKKVEKVAGKQKIEPKEEAQHAIIKTFNEMFKETFQNKEPTETDVGDVFEWLRSQGENATKLLEADICRDLVLKTETHFWRFSKMKGKASSEAKKTLKKIRKRFDDLRKIQGKIAVQTPVISGEREETKIVPKK